MKNVNDKTWKHNNPTEVNPAHDVKSSLAQQGKTEVLLVDAKIAEVLKKLGLAKDKAIP